MKHREFTVTIGPTEYQVHVYRCPGFVGMRVISENCRFTIEKRLKKLESVIVVKLSDRLYYGESMYGTGVQRYIKDMRGPKLHIGDKLWIEHE